MFLRKVIATLTFSLIVPVLFAQNPSAKVRIVDLENVATVINNVTTSSSLGSDDFPVYLNGIKQIKQFGDLYMILVRHDLQASDPNLYISVELIDMEEHSSIYEMAKYMRVSGESETGPFSIKVMEINSIEVKRKGY